MFIDHVTLRELFIQRLDHANAILLKIELGRASAGSDQHVQLELDRLQRKTEAAIQSLEETMLVISMSN